MKRVYKIVCRGSWLALAQAELFKAKLLSVAPTIEFEIIVKETEGDRNPERVLQEMDGKDFFTKDIQEFLESGQADFAVHSLKDVSGENFFGQNHYAIFERDDPRDVAIFNENVLTKIANGSSLSIGTSSPRRARMATQFLKEALPQLNNHSIAISADSIRGNVDTRLRKLNAGQFDGIILAAAGLNRLLNYEASREEVSELLSGKKIMVLPLFDCPPAPGQGAIVAETTGANAEAIHLLQKINQPHLVSATEQERIVASKYGSGCHQQFGVVSISLPRQTFTFGAGVYMNPSGEETVFEEYRRNEKVELKYEKVIFADELVTAVYTPLGAYEKDEHVKALYATDSSSLQHHSSLTTEQIWTIDSNVWFELAQKGIWVVGCADGLGVEFISAWWRMPLLNIQKSNVVVLTNNLEEARWKALGWTVHVCCKKEFQVTEKFKQALKVAEFIFWRDVELYRICKNYLSDDTRLGCVAGQTESEFEKEGILPSAFSSINEFDAWRKNNTTISEG